MMSRKNGSLICKHGEIEALFGGEEINRGQIENRIWEKKPRGLRAKS